MKCRGFCDRPSAVAVAVIQTPRGLLSCSAATRFCRGKANPATTRQAAYLASQPVPASFATVPYWSTNAFIAANAAGKTQALRWRFEPVAGRVEVSGDEA